LVYVASSTADPLLKADIFALMANKRVQRLGATGAPTTVQQGSQYRFTRTFQMDWSNFCQSAGLLQLFVFAYTSNRSGGLKNKPFINYSLFEPATPPASCSAPKNGPIPPPPPA
jgi:hypothetical protein